MELTKDALANYISLLGYEIGDYTYGVPNLLFGLDARLKIGKYCSIAAGVAIFLGGNHRVDWVTTYPFSDLPETWGEAAGIPGHPSTKGDVKIGNDVWLGLNSVIMSGVTIGNGCVVAAFSVVTKDVPPYTIVGGNPARVIKTRFSEEQIKYLELIKWWDFPEAKLRELIPYLLSTDIDYFINKAVEFIRLENSTKLQRASQAVEQAGAALESLDQ